MRLSHNVIAGVGNSALTALLGLVLTPFYLHFLGIEAYGLIGFFIAMQALLSLLDLGLSPTMNREVARASAASDRSGVRGLLRFLEIAAVVIALAMACTVVGLASRIAEHWLEAPGIPPEQLAGALALMGVAIACRWPAGLFQATVNGAQRIVLSSTISSAYTTFAGLGAVCVLAFGSATVGAFFAWQALAAFLYTIAARIAAWHTLGGRRGEGASFPEVRRVWRFSAGMGVIAVTSVLFTHLDKALLSAILSLEEFGRYTLATLLASGIYVLVMPVFNAVYPRFSALVAAGDHRSLLQLYSTGTRGLASLVFPLASTLAVFAEPVLALWTQDPTVARSTAPILSLLVAGAALHAVMYFPYALQLSHGVPRITVMINVTMLVLLVPITVLLTLNFGSTGAAAAWLALHAFHLFLGTYVTHRHLLRGYAGRWLGRDVGVPLLLTLVASGVALAGGARTAGDDAARLFWVAFLLFVPSGLSLAMAPDFRKIIPVRRMRPAGHGNEGGMS